MTGQTIRTSSLGDLRGIERLLVATGRGDASHFADIYDALAPCVYGLAYRVLGDQRQAEDVAREVFEEVWRTAATFDPAHGSALAWTMTITHRRAVDRMRSARVSPRREESDDRLTTSMPLDRDALSPGQQEALELAYFGGHTHVEVSRLMKTPAIASATRLRDGLRCLREAIIPPAAEPA